MPCGQRNNFKEQMCGYTKEFQALVFQVHDRGTVQLLKMGLGLNVDLSLSVNFSGPESRMKVMYNYIQ